ncbi:exodeoxyribonuclease V subunit alpha [Litoribacillus peritrichatus]|uniref:RecBCD enzyme subunit RecD n=1 Tax=Litoribacillus peritrichatus TaxID=718191 RepID=A0ABP7MBN8_9GAMM
MRQSATLNLLEHYHQLGLIRGIDLEFARFAFDQTISNSSIDKTTAEKSAELAAKYGVLVSHYLGRGHVCVDLLKVSQQKDPFDFEEKKQGLVAKTELMTFDYDSDQQWLEQFSVDSSEAQSLLVLEDSKLYLNRYWCYEQQVARYIEYASQPEMNVPLLTEIVNSLFSSAPTQVGLTTTSSSTAVDYQKVAAAVALTNQVSVITGGPGTGKTYTVVRILAGLLTYAQRSGHALPKIKLAAPTGKAAARMLESIRSSVSDLSLDEVLLDFIPREASTLHRLLGSIPNDVNFRHHEDNPLHLDVLIVDEASMIDLPMMSKLLSAMPKNGRLILLGDRDQLASVEAGSVLNDLCVMDKGYSRKYASLLKSVTGYELEVDENSKEGGFQDCLAWLKISRRFDAQSGVGVLAKAVNSGDQSQVSNFIGSGDFADVRQYLLSEANYNLCLDQAAREYEAYLKAVTELNHCEAMERFSDVRVLCALREGIFGVEGLNLQIEHRLAKKGLIDTTSEWYSGRPIMVLQNDYGQQLFNGDIGLVMPDEAGQLRVYFEVGQTLKSVLPNRVPKHETAYAMTVHKSQGSEFAHSVMILPDRMSPVITRELLYTGITRAKKRLSLLYQPAVLSEAVQNPVERFSGLADKLA